MLRTTTFDRNLWQLTTFESISYDKEEQILIIHFLDETTLKFDSIPENLVFEFILTTNKDYFIETKLKPLQYTT
ncbi:KTSC domain-containing protein [Gracilibacillus caseinilyticus]|uniref:KTSC domain-containing protein n=1 Tax=Gracilibacillus caseinilyticus TaxID=2932256 RepID=A0ABY4EUN0_9BACI|nr:KTSC domain-containing protein [Gracilibacillus caseinilyticus]UOQ47354.1 KTSC domain-containing protein [Gracilibacillus caseinilyticus]